MLRDLLRAGFARGDLLGAGAVAAAATVLGLGTAWLWSALSPRVVVVVTESGPALVEYYTENYIADDMVFGLVGLVTGLVLGGVAYGLRRWRGPAVLVGLVLGSLAGAIVSWKVGSQFGAAEYRHLLESDEVGRRFEMPVRLGAVGLVCLQPIAATIVYVVAAAWSPRPDLGVAPGGPPMHGGLPAASRGNAPEDADKPPESQDGSPGSRDRPPESRDLPRGSLDRAPEQPGSAPRIPTTARKNTDHAPAQRLSPSVPDPPVSSATTEPGAARAEPAPPEAGPASPPPA